MQIMQKIILGRTGLEVTAAGLGCGGHSRLGMFTKGVDNAVRIVRCAVENGVNFIDTAHVYGTQPAIGMALETTERSSYVLSSKFPYLDHGGLRPAGDLERIVDVGLAELKTDYIDIYHLHGVLPEHYEAVRERFYPELQRIKQKGKIRFIGITEAFSADCSHQTLQKALEDDLWDVMMVGYNIINPSAAKTILPKAREKNIGILNMFAVRSALSDPEKLKHYVQKMIAAGQADERLVPEARTFDFLTENGWADSVMEAAYRFCRHTPGIDVTLTGTGSVEHLRDNLKSIFLPPLPQEALDRFEKMFGKVDCVSGD